MRFSKLLALWTGLFVLIIVSFLSGVQFSKEDEVKASNRYCSTEGLPGEQFIKHHMTNANHTLKTNLKPQADNDSNIARGNQALSESLGLWMMYALEKGDKALFAQNVEVLRKHFNQDGWIAWKIGEHTPSVSTNALVDDLRIAEALYRAGDKWKAADYQELANEIGDSVVWHQYKDGLFTDFYDNRAQRSSEVLTLSYLSGAAFTQMYEHHRMKEGTYRQTVSFLQNIPTRHDFFPFSYNLTTKKYEYHTDVNLIDQLYIVYHRAQAGFASPDLWTFIKSEFSRQGLLHGKYDAATKQPTVQYESPAVYGLAILAAVQLHDGEFARELYFRMIQKQIRKPESPFYGGYLDTDAMDTHMFDNLVPLLAERKLYNEGLLH